MKSQLALIVPLSGGGGRPDNTLPGGGGGGQPDNTLPGGGGGQPDNTLPGGSIDNSLPLPPVTIDNTLPETPEKPIPPPQIALPIVLPPTINPTPPAPARYFELKYTVRFGWVLVPVSDLVAAPKR